MLSSNPLHKVVSVKVGEDKKEWKVERMKEIARHVSSQLLMEFSMLLSVQSTWKYMEYCSDTLKDPTHTLNEEHNVQLNEAVLDV